MRILFTGASSFTGYWFIKELTARGHQVISACRKKVDYYKGTCHERLKQLSHIATLHYDCELGSDNFLRLLYIEKEGFDLFCHHAAYMTNYKNEPSEALAKNTHCFPQIFKKLQETGCRSLLLTGSNSEPNEENSPNSSATSPYGLSKDLASYAQLSGMRLKKFIIPDTFGPVEESSCLASSLIRSWQQERVPVLSHPAYIRDNVPVDLLAKAYFNFIQNTDQLLRPSFYIETQEAFARRLSKEIKKRLDLSCELICKEQTAFAEPRIRINHDYLAPEDYGWSEQRFWDALADYFEKTE